MNDTYNIVKESQSINFDMRGKFLPPYAPSNYYTNIHNFYISDIEFGKKYTYIVKGDNTDNLLEGPFNILLQDPYSRT